MALFQTFSVKKIRIHHVIMFIKKGKKKTSHIRVSAMQSFTKRVVQPHTLIGASDWTFLPLKRFHLSMGPDIILISTMITKYEFTFSTLISAFDKAKKKYQSKLKKLESQMQSLTERYETQVGPLSGITKTGLSSIQKI